MTTFPSSLPNDLLQKLDDFARQYGVSKNKIIKKALSIYLDQLNRAKYAKSFQTAGLDKETMAIAEEGMEAYLSKLD
ncbi:CopG family transcriptional regulator [Christiangramia forsetii]|uniref:CopG family transcriptional regulator n=2 Tax=Christiangramia forsetii TaxID=411153 RepID=A0M4H4_CHRFK|nr:CopG family transcriptional regulator [Christiangramia forsetii]GGG23448.1 hypothetical protein GCM10011532_03210 [Christiangramia forsetii]CAL67519.1 conserved hypothetical protein [Christiangramia forsetii KT0803]